MYLIDSDVLIDAKNRHYGFDFVPAFWDWIAQQHQAGRVFTVQKVADEVLAGADELAQWMRIQPASFRIAAGPNDQASLRAVSQWATNTQAVSTCTKSTARTALAWVARNCLQLGPDRRGAGSIELERFLRGAQEGNEALRRLLRSG